MIFVLLVALGDDPTAPVFCRHADGSAALRPITLWKLAYATVVEGDASARFRAFSEFDPRCFRSPGRGGDLPASDEPAGMEIPPALPAAGGEP